MGWKFEAGTPLTVQIASRLRHDILAGIYPLGGDFPTVRQLAAEASVNPNTIQKALTVLEDEGLIVTLGTSGRTVTTDSRVIGLAREKESCRFAEGVIKEARLLGFDEEGLIEIIRRTWNNEQ